MGEGVDILFCLCFVLLFPVQHPFPQFLPTLQGEPLSLPAFSFGGTANHSNYGPGLRVSSQPRWATPWCSSLWPGWPTQAHRHNPSWANWSDLWMDSRRAGGQDWAGVNLEWSKVKFLVFLTTWRSVRGGRNELKFQKSKAGGGGREKRGKERDKERERGRGRWGGGGWEGRKMEEERREWGEKRRGLERMRKKQREGYREGRRERE